MNFPLKLSFLLFFLVAQKNKSTNRFKALELLQSSNWNGSFYNSDHNILRFFDVLPNFAFTTSETKRDYYQ